MYDSNTKIRLLNELSTCTYLPANKDYLANMIAQVMNYPSKQGQARHYIKQLSTDKIIMVWFPMAVPFGGRNYSVPLQVYFMKNSPYEPPQVFLEVVTGSAVNTKNHDIDPNTRRILTNSLRCWNQYTPMDTVMTEILTSFKATFPIYKVKNPAQQAQQQQPIQPNLQTYGQQQFGTQQQQPAANYYGLYGYQQQAQAPKPATQAQGNYYFAPPTTSIYGQSMIAGQPQQQQQAQAQQGGGIYSNNLGMNFNQSNGIYGNNQNLNKGGGNILTSSSGIYGITSPNNPSGSPLQVNPGVQQIPQNQQGGYYQNSLYQQPNINHDEEFKKIMINVVFDKLSGKVIEENQKLNQENKVLVNYKNKFNTEGQKLKTFLNQQQEINFKCNNDINTISTEIQKIQEYNTNNQSKSLTPENCINYINVQDPNAIKVIADEANLEELMLVVRKGFEKKKVNFHDAINFIRNTSRELFGVKFMKKKVISKYGGLE